MFVEQVMITPVISVEPETPVGRAWERLQGWRCRHLPVVAGGTLVGIVSDRDLRVALASDGGQRVDAIMHRGVVTVEPGTPIEEASREMLEHKIGALPVIDREQLVGIVTETDLLRLLVRMLQLMEPRDRVELELRAEAAFGEGVLGAFSA